MIDVFTCLSCPFLDNPSDKFNLIEEEKYLSLFCNKIGGKIWWYSNCGCEDMYLSPIETKKNNTKKQKYKKRNKHQNKFLHKKRLKELKEITWWAIRTRIDENGKEYLTRDYYNNKRFYKKQLNKKVRKCKWLNGKGSNYKKLYDIKWEIW